MNQRQFVRNIGRIPRLLFHIKRVKARAKGQTGADKEFSLKRVAGFETELKRRKLEMELADMQEQSEVHAEGYVPKKYADVLARLLKVKLDHQVTDESIALKEWIKEESIGMPTGAAELTT